MVLLWGHYGPLWGLYRVIMGTQCSSMQSLGSFYWVILQILGGHNETVLGSL